MTDLTAYTRTADMAMLDNVAALAGLAAALTQDIRERVEGGAEFNYLTRNALTEAGAALAEAVGALPSIPKNVSVTPPGAKLNTFEIGRMYNRKLRNATNA